MKVPEEMWMPAMMMEYGYPANAFNSEEEWLDDLERRWGRLDAITNGVELDRQPEDELPPMPGIDSAVVYLPPEIQREVEVTRAYINRTMGMVLGFIAQRRVELANGTGSINKVTMPKIILKD